MAEEEAAPEEAPAEEEGDDAADMTIFSNFYTTKILPPYDESREEKQEKEFRTARDYTIALTDDNADEFGDITHVGWKGRIDYAMKEFEEEKKRAIVSGGEVYRDPNRLLEVTISTIILMASGSTDVPMENYLYTELYLKNIKDENGDHPPNISNLLKHMRYLKKQYDIKWGEEYKASPPESLVVAKITKKSKIPVKINRSAFTSAIEDDLNATTDAGGEGGAEGGEGGGGGEEEE